MTGNLLSNIKDYLIKMTRNKFKDLNVMAYCKCLEDNLHNLEELIISSEYKEYDLSISRDEESGIYTLKVLYQYNVPDIVFYLNFVKYDDVVTGKDYRLEVTKTEEVGYFDYNIDNQNYETNEEEQYHKNIIEEQLIKQITFEKKYIEMREKNLIDLENQLAKLTA